MPPKSTKGMSTGGGKSAEELQAELKKWLLRKPPFKSDAKVNSFGLAVGQTASQSLKDFISVFEPLTAETADGERLRAQDFLAADPNGEIQFDRINNVAK